MRTYHITFKVQDTRTYLAFIARSQDRAIGALRAIYAGTRLLVLLVEVE